MNISEEVKRLKQVIVVGDENMGWARAALLKQCINWAAKGSGNLFLEFGVATGKTINFFSKLIPNKTVYGFDWFGGLPEKWWGCPVGHFKQDTLPEVRENVELIIGKFENTLDDFAATHPGQIAFAHIDCDIYSATKTIFDKLGDRFQKDTVIQFDEFYNYPTFAENEMKAFLEFVDKRQLKYKYIGRTKQFQAALRIL